MPGESNISLVEVGIEEINDVSWVYILSMNRLLKMEPTVFFLLPDDDRVCE